MSPLMITITDLRTTSRFLNTLDVSQIQTSLQKWNKHIQSKKFKKKKQKKNSSVLPQAPLFDAEKTGERKLNEIFRIQSRKKRASERRHLSVFNPCATEDQRKPECLVAQHLQNFGPNNRYTKRWKPSKKYGWGLLLCVSCPANFFLGEGGGSYSDTDQDHEFSAALCGTQERLKTNLRKFVTRLLHSCDPRPRYWRKFWKHGDGIISLPSGANGARRICSKSCFSKTPQKVWRTEVKKPSPLQRGASDRLAIGLVAGKVKQDREEEENNWQEKKKTIV